MDIKSAEKSIFRNILKLLTGEGLARIITFAAAPVITRIYTPEDMGVLGVFASLIAIIAPFTCLSYSSAIPINRNNKTTGNLIFSCLIIMLSITALSFFVSLFAGRPILTALSMSSIVSYWYLIPIGIFLKGLFEIFSQYSVRQKEFGLYAKATVAQKVSGSLIKIGLGFLKVRPLGLLIGDLFTSAGGLWLFFKKFWKDFMQFRKSLSLNKMRYSLRRYKKFPLFRLPSQVILALTGNIPILFFAWKFNDATVGQIKIALTMISIPITFIGYAVGKSFLGEIAEIGSRNGAAIYKISIDIIKKLSSIGFIMFLGFFFLSQWLFPLVFGAQWQEAGMYAKYFSIFLCFRFIYSPLSEGVFNVFERQGLILLIEIIRAVLIGLILYGSYIYDLDAKATVIVYSIGLTVLYGVSSLIIMGVLHKNRRK